MAGRVNRVTLDARPTRQDPRIAALLHARLAIGQARSGDRTGAGRSLLAAERAYDRVGTEPPPPTPTPTHQEAQDGRDFDACLDRACEVEVREGDTIRFAPEFVTDTFTVDRITDSKVEYSATDDQPAPLRGYVGGTGEVETGDIRVDFDRTDDGRIILRFSPR